MERVEELETALKNMTEDRLHWRKKAAEQQDRILELETELSKYRDGMVPKNELTILRTNAKSSERAIERLKEELKQTRDMLRGALAGESVDGEKPGDAMIQVLLELRTDVAEIKKALKVTE